MSRKKFDTKIAEDAAKRFRMLCEYTFNITEDDGEEEIPQTNNSEDNDVDTEEPMQQTQDLDKIPQVDGSSENTPTGFNPQEDGMGDNIDNNSAQPDDEVIDVDDLTTSQEETEDKVDNIQASMNKSFDKLFDVVTKLSKMVDSSIENMETLKQELEKRNPTPIEKLNMRAANDSYPFNVSPNTYWKNKELSSNYRIGGEDDKDAEQYTITQGDIDSITDYQRISQELNSVGLNQNLMNIFGLH